MNKLKYIIVAAALLCGCQQKNQSDEARISALETTVSNLQWLGERRRDAINFNASNDDWAFSNQNILNSNIAALVQTNCQEIEWLQLQVDFHQIQLNSVSDAISNIMGRLHVGWNGQYYSQPSQSGQMPAEVAAGIRAEAERRYPTDYDMQLYVIKEQTEAWYKLHGQ